MKNLTPFSATENRERTVEMARKAGIASGISRKKRKTFAEETKIALEAAIQASHPKYAEMKKMVRSMGLLQDGDPSNQLLIIAGMIMRAQKDPAAAAFLRDTIGERPKEDVDVSVNAPPIVIGIHDQAYVERERIRQEQMLNDIGSGEVVDVEADSETPDDDKEAAETGESVSEKTDEPPKAEMETPTDQQHTAEKPTVDASKPQQPQHQRPMTRAEAVAAMEAERRAKGGGEGKPSPVKPMFLPSGFGRSR